jgi:hypothetical protein
MASKGAGARRKRILLFEVIAAGALAWSGPARARFAQDSKEKPAGEAQVMGVTARKIGVRTGRIHLTGGSKVRLKLHSNHRLTN